MSELELKEFRERMKALSDEETNEIVKLIADEKLWNELFRRNTKMLQRINQIEEVIGVNMDNIMPIPIETWNEIRHRYEDIEEKYKRIRKLGGNN